MKLSCVKSNTVLWVVSGICNRQFGREPIRRIMDCVIPKNISQAISIKLPICVVKIFQKELNIYTFFVL